MAVVGGFSVCFFHCLFSHPVRRWAVLPTHLGKVGSQSVVSCCWEPGFVVWSLDT